MDRWCEKCGGPESRVVETLEHVLVECPHYSVLREGWINGIKNIIGEDGWAVVRDGEVGDCLSLLLGFGEGAGLADLARNFLVGMWRRRDLAAGGGVVGDHNYVIGTGVG